MIEPYNAVGLVPTFWGIRRREDIGKNIEHLTSLAKTALWMSNLDIPVRLLAIPEGALQGFNDEVLDVDHAEYTRTCAIDIPGAETFGIVMDVVKPRMAVAYHFFNDFDTRYPIYDGIRKAYKGPLTMATDLLVWNVTKANINVRRAIVNQESWPAKPLTPPGQPDPKQRASFTAFVDGGREDVVKELAPQIEQFKKKYGLK